MPLKKSDGNMYPWVSHMHTHLAGECPHRCSYCYVTSSRFGKPKRYQGPIRLIEDEFKVNYGSGKTIFMEHCHDLFAEDVPSAFIDRILSHCKTWPDNTYVFQTKNPCRYGDFLEKLPDKIIIGTTIETNRLIPPELSMAPRTSDRMYWMYSYIPSSIRKFVTIEPVMDFDVDILAEWIRDIKPDFLNLGADSKGHKLPEPSFEKIEALTAKLNEYGIELREKHNLDRLMRR